MARVVAFIPDLMFGSGVQAALTAAGHEVELVSELAPEVDADVLIVDLTIDPAERIEQARRTDLPTLGVYAHVEADVRAQAEQAGFNMVVPRSRMARQGPELVTKLLSNIA
jgi:hypothetical protein